MKNIKIYNQSHLVEEPRYVHEKDLMRRFRKVLSDTEDSTDDSARSGGEDQLSNGNSF